MADASTRTDYAALVKAETSTLPLRMVRDAIVELFPTPITTSDVLRILAEVNIEDDTCGLDFKRDGAVLASRLDSAAELELFLTGLLGQLGTQLGDHSHHPPTKREEVFFPAMAEAALRLLKATPTNDAPDAAIDSLLRISNRREHGSSLFKTANVALVELHRTAERRRRAFWRVVTTLRTVSKRQPIDQVWHIGLLGYPTDLKIEDVEWLLADGLAKGGLDCRLAVNAALLIYRSQGEPASLLAKIWDAVESDPIGQEAFVNGRHPALLLNQNWRWSRNFVTSTIETRRNWTNAISGGLSSSGAFGQIRTGSPD